MYMSIQFGK